MAPFSIAEGIIKVFLKWSGWKLTMFLRDQLQIGHYKEPPDAGRQLWLSVGAFPMAEYTKCHSWIILATYGKSIAFRNDCLFWRHVPFASWPAFVVGALNVQRISKSDRISEIQIANCNCNSSSCKNSQYASCICNELSSVSSAVLMNGSAK